MCVLVGVANVVDCGVVYVDVVVGGVGYVGAGCVPMWSVVSCDVGDVFVVGFGNVVVGAVVWWGCRRC